MKIQKLKEYVRAVKSQQASNAANGGDEMGQMPEYHQLGALSARPAYGDRKGVPTNSVLWQLPKEVAREHKRSLLLMDPDPSAR